MKNIEFWKIIINLYVIIYDVIFFNNVLILFWLMELFKIVLKMDVKEKR